MLLVCVICKGWESLVHIRQSQSPWSEISAVLVHGSVMLGEDKKALPSRSLHQLQGPGTVQRQAPVLMPRVRGDEVG